MGRHHGKRRTRRKPQGFSEPGLRQLCDLFFLSRPGKPIQGRKKRLFFNDLAARWVVLTACVCAFGGAVQFGLGGGLLGFTLALVIGGWIVQSNRFYR